MLTVANDSNRVASAWGCFVTGCVRAAGEAGLDPTAVSGRFANHSGVATEGDALALYSYFSAPVHRCAVQKLDAGLLSSPIPFASGPFPLQDVLRTFAATTQFARVWGSLLDVAVACGVPEPAEARAFLRQQPGAQPAGSGSVSVCAAGAGGLLGGLSVVDVVNTLSATFPVYSDCIQAVGRAVSQLSTVEKPSQVRGIVQPLTNALVQTLHPDCAPQLSASIDRLMENLGTLAEQLEAASDAKAAAAAVNGPTPS
jgi:hypothetical protein